MWVVFCYEWMGGRCGGGFFERDGCLREVVGVERWLWKSICSESLVLD